MSIKPEFDLHLNKYVHSFAAVEIASVIEYRNSQSKEYQEYTVSQSTCLTYKKIQESYSVFLLDFCSYVGTALSLF